MKPSKLALFAAIPATLLAMSLLLTNQDVRNKVLGVGLTYQPVAQAKQKLLLELRIAEGREIQGQASQSPIETSESSSLEAEIEESVQGVSDSQFDLIYRLTQMRSEQYAWRQGKSGKLLDEKWEAHVNALGPLADCKNLGDNPSPWLQPQNLEGWLSALWLGLPHERVRIMDAWSAETQVPLKAREFRDPLVLLQRFNYHLTRMYEQGGIPLAQIEWTGTVTALPPATGSGKLNGAAVIDMRTKLCLQADFNLDQELHAPIPGLPGGEDEAVIFAWHQKQHGTVKR